MDIPSPEEVRATFIKLQNNNPEDAVTYLHELGLSSGYIKKEANVRNIRWNASSPFGTLECSINLSKPEKDPRSIAAEATTQATSSNNQPNPNIPQCDLCWENEEFPGSPEHPAKPGLRIAALSLGNESWGLQFSPYAYFEEHCIVLSKKHRPMKVDRVAIERLLDFVDLFPFYFIGSNADLPIVGGSILSHDHFQGGRHEFPLMKAPLERSIHLKEFSEVSCGIVRWPASVLRLTSDNRSSLTRAAEKILKTWHGYSNEECDIIAATDAQHNTLNPIARKVDNHYILDLVLRNNRTDAAHPWGIFHAPETAHHLKKENIGLIEIMGMAIFPPRLAIELPLIQRELVEAVQQNLSPNELTERLENMPSISAHTSWAVDIFCRRNSELAAIKSSPSPGVTPTDNPPSDELSPLIKQEVAQVFASLLEATGVFKHQATGRAGWNDFIDKLNGKR